MADVPARCSKPLANIRSALPTTKQLLNMLKELARIVALVEELRVEGSRIVLRKSMANSLMVMSDDVRSIHETQWKSSSVTQLSSTWPGTGDPHQAYTLRASLTKIWNGGCRTSMVSAMSRTGGNRRAQQTVPHPETPQQPPHHTEYTEYKVARLINRLQAQRNERRIRFDSGV